MIIDDGDFEGGDLHVVMGDIDLAFSLRDAIDTDMAAVFMIPFEFGCDDFLVAISRH